jgi:hypothetical protein
LRLSDAGRADGSQASLEEMRDCSERIGVFFEDWTGSLRPLCKACSEGLPHDEHDTNGNDAWIARRRVGLAAKDHAGIDTLMSEWKHRRLATVIDVKLELRARR